MAINPKRQRPYIDYNYTYDLVGNVTQVASTCPWLQNQSFTENFSYDSTDQLTAAQESQNNGYQLVVNYDNWGKVMQYDIAQTDMLNNATETHSRSYSYPAANYAVAQTSFAPIMQTGDEQISLSYGINGSLRKKEVTQPQQNTEYYLFNSQGNLKAYSDDIMSFAYYGYNAANTRTYKISLNNANIWINGQQQPLNMQLQNAMFYPNQYLNFDAFGNYTKHYYNGMERIASRLGDNTITIAINNDNTLEDRKLSLEEQFRLDIHKLIEETISIDLPPFIDVNALQPTGTPNDIYYYHPNHLGSTSFVTDQNQTITQGFLYAPFGEITTEYNVNFGNNVIPKYSFNAKELDEETGMYYYEARYYKPPVFTSRDPMFEKYFWMTPYAYCANNPVKYVDPSGEEVIEQDGGGKNYEPKDRKKTSYTLSQQNSKYNTSPYSSSQSVSKTTTITTAWSIRTNPLVTASINKSTTNEDTKLLNVDNNTITTYSLNSPSTITQTSEYQVKTSAIGGSVYGGSGTDKSIICGISLSIGPIQVGVSAAGSPDVINSSININVGINCTSNNSIGASIGIKPLGIATTVGAAILRRFIPSIVCPVQPVNISTSPIIM